MKMLKPEEDFPLNPDYVNGINKFQVVLLNVITPAHSARVLFDTTHFSKHAIIDRKIKSC